MKHQTIVFLSLAHSAGAFNPMPAARSAGPSPRFQLMKPSTHQVSHTQVDCSQTRLESALAEGKGISIDHGETIWRENSTRRLVKSFISLAMREAKMTVGLMRSNSLATILVGSTSALAFAHAGSTLANPIEWIQLPVKLLMWYLGFGYSFDIGNQIVGVEEDRRNLGEQPEKAGRPIATGEMSLNGAKIRQILSTSYFLGVSWLLGGQVLTSVGMLWVTLSVLYNYLHGDRHFLTKNVFFIGAGSVAILLGARAIAGETASSIIPQLLISLWLGCCMDLQDFRDEEGDKALERKTTTVIWGVKKARKIWSVTVGISTGAIGWMLKNYLSWQDAVITAGILHTVLSAMDNNNPKDDQKTYTYFSLLGMLFFCRSPYWSLAM